MGIHMLESILRIRCMVLEYTTLEMDIAMKEPGTRERGKGLAFTLSEMGKISVVTGRMGFLMFQVVLAPFRDLLQQSTILKCFMQSRIFLYCSPEARQAAEKAINVTKLDERPKRAVTVANKSATSARVAAVKAVQNQIHQNGDNCHSPLSVV
ncbi:hypothetical protein HAX54_044699 [Datura stramonium]|uniref:Uncharacterized protein n=1 Tax=Datura stramonium TaxID=4076 RepID=A0ABS8SPS2_DATST|nr:hypothetical protein [Datura stramonium]